ncbi:solute carrier family 13 member 4 isoform X2 [Callorhinchus milii]|uniref:solute carrier family 13 member 4 isoform X2 n=1 Tax=Callorhinchus milii TaxID=7868 RepID=UPI00045756B3|nr:solute carrier family 13 member 4 isoform X2 [Callorhinchus milii]|eukprot:gi/632961387/ref/XP_007896728.1/ PREDICTED: solute carrier family 13 member 4 [Callorhinchus milii]
MGSLRNIWRARKLLLVILIPLLLLPLPLLYPDNPEASCAYVVIVTAVYWVSEAVPLGAAAMVPAFLFPLFGVLKASEVASEYFKDTTLLLIGVICLAASIEKWNLHKRIALRMVMIAGAKPGMLVLGFMCCTVFLSMWLSNTSTTAMVMPIAEAVLQQLINTSLESDVELAVITDTDSAEDTYSSSSSQKYEEENEKKQLEFILLNENGAKNNQLDLQMLSQPKDQDVNALTSLVVPNGQVKPNVLLPQGQTELPHCPTKLSKEYSNKYKTKHDHMICKCLSLSITYAATIGGLMTITGTSTNLIFAEQFNSRYPDARSINFGTWFVFSFPIAIIMLVLTWVWMHWLFLGCNFQETCSLSKKRKTKREEMSERRIQEEYEKLGPFRYPEMVTGIFFVLMTLLWFTREPGFVPGWTSLFEKKGYRTDATVSIFLGFLLFLIPAKKPSLPCFGKTNNEEESDKESKSLENSKACEISNPLSPLINWKDFQKHMPWEIVILVGGGYTLASGCKVSGLSDWIGSQMEPMTSLPPWAVTLIACLLVSVVTEFASNPATITVFLPILSTLSETLQINPLYTLIPATMCVSFGVMLPVGNPPNAIVFSYGHCQIQDMVKAGFGVNVIGVLAVMLAINTWGFPLFQLEGFPDWVLVKNVTESF